MACLENEEDQRRGFVVIWYITRSAAPNHKFDPGLSWSFMKLRLVLPFRHESAHACFDDMKLRCAISLGIWISGSYGRVRFRSHYGTHSAFIGLSM